MWSNQLRLYFSSITYVLLQTLRRIGLAGTVWEKAQCGTIRRKLLKIGAQIRVAVRKVWISLAGGIHTRPCLPVCSRDQSLSLLSPFGAGTGLASRDQLLVELSPAWLIVGPASSGAAVCPRKVKKLICVNSMMVAG
jgi:hypothetical protein